ncbi:hypothetical protein D3C76_1012660 [compost metagenome]
MGQFAGQVFTEQAVGQEQATDDWQRNPHHPSSGFEDQGNQHKTHHHVGWRQVAGALDQIGLEHPLIQRGGDACQAEQPGQRLPGPGFTLCRVTQEDHPEQETDVYRAQYLA